MAHNGTYLVCKNDAPKKYGDMTIHEKINCKANYASYRRFMGYKVDIGWAMYKMNPALWLTYSLVERY